MEDTLHAAHLLLQDPKVLIGFVLILSLLVGSFLNVVIYRLPKMMEKLWYDQCTNYFANAQEPGEAVLPHPQVSTPFNLWFPRSHCPQCHRSIRPWENIPLLSYLFLRGKCGGCQAHIPFRYPFVELLSALLSIFLAYHYGYSSALFAALFLTWLLIALTFIDIDTQLLPDDLTYLGLWAGLVLSVFNVFVSPTQSILGAVFGYLSLWSLYWVFKWFTHKEGLGYGDFKLMALAGAWLGWQALPLVIFIASFTGAVYGLTNIVLKNMHKDHPLPFGPFIALGIWLTLLYGDKIYHTYLNWMI